jgi:hypothetical protein
MTLPLDLEIRHQLGRYLDREQSLREFVEWWAPRGWDIHRSGDPSAVALAGEVDLRLAEYTNGDWAEADLRRFFRPLVQNYTVNTARPAVWASSGARLIHQMLAAPGLEHRPLARAS